ncbi:MULTISPECIES: plastocyanin/azurin family copper-binding protein [Pseudomonas]|uniref:Cupredoxin family protein n=1 Tax=Pseudomonas gessardii TaxID=78544 RepID=A0A7Y1QJG0_9PSED|nr:MULTISPECIES: cupredoxin family protein [Pseudomonas]MBH3424014.1 cupredoxin family protein [Pseudomonas gessardii]MRU49289.1 copper-binding protein [Pseudomonas gessardii]NNA66257.1 cupredoxin family protein [Pseudomonas gessardii]NNA88855.1 cupredoxin family protein [Pseudomonas gessardii]NNA93604.1 cupredoxin family protein [Pseudomonas gessardii]
MLLRKTWWWVGCLMALSAPALADGAHTFAFGEAAPASKATRTVEVLLQDISFAPTSLDVKAGETVRFVLVNKGQLLHEFNLGDAAMHADHQKEMLKMQASGMLTTTGMGQMDHAAMGHGDMGGMKHDDPNSMLVEPGKTAELTWTFSKTGALEFACNLPGHYQAGMVGKLNVNP